MLTAAPGGLRCRQQYAVHSGGTRTQPTTRVSRGQVRKMRNPSRNVTGGCCAIRGLSQRSAHARTIELRRLAVCSNLRSVRAPAISSEGGSRTVHIACLQRNRMVSGAGSLLIERALPIRWNGESRIGAVCLMLSLAAHKPLEWSKVSSQGLFSRKRFCLARLTDFQTRNLVADNRLMITMANKRRAEAHPLPEDGG